MENDFAIWWDSVKRLFKLTVNFLMVTGTQTMTFNQDFREYMMEEYYDELRGNINEQVEKAGGGESHDGVLDVVMTLTLKKHQLQKKKQLFLI